MLTELCAVIGEVGQKPMAGDNGAILGEDGGRWGDKGALLILMQSTISFGNEWNDRAGLGKRLS